MNCKPQKYLFVGGTYDGRWLTLDYPANEVNRPKLERFPTKPIYDPRDPIDTEYYNLDRYYYRSFNFARGHKVEIYAHETIKQESELMEALMHCYRVDNK